MTRKQWVHVLSSFLLAMIAGGLGYALMAYYDAPTWARHGVYYIVAMNTYTVVVRSRSS